MLRTRVLPRRRAGVCEGLAMNSALQWRTEDSVIGWSSGRYGVLYNFGSGIWDKCLFCRSAIVAEHSTTLSLNSSSVHSLIKPLQEVHQPMQAGEWREALYGWQGIHIVR
jgi:hypothetical protein